MNESKTTETNQPPPSTVTADFGIRNYGRASDAHLHNRWCCGRNRDIGDRAERHVHGGVVVIGADGVADAVDYDVEGPAVVHGDLHIAYEVGHHLR